MGANSFRFLTIALFAAVASGQNSTDESVDRVIHLPSIEKTQELQEVATVIRSIADIRSLSVDSTQRSLSVHGTTEQIAIAESLARELVPQAGQAPDAYEFKLSTGDLVRVYYLPHTANVQDFQAVVTTIRSITDVRWFFTYNARRAAVVRGTQTQMGMTEWLVQQLDQPTSAQSAPAEYRVPGTGDDVVQVYYAKHVDTQQSLQELASVVRSIGNIRRLFATLNPRAVALRGTSDEMALADFLFQQLDQPTSGPSQSGAAAEYLMSGSGGNVVRVFHLNNVTIQGFQSLATEVRAMANAPQVIPYNALGALALRGTADQIAAAKGLIDERVKR